MRCRRGGPQNSQPRRLLLLAYPLTLAASSRTLVCLQGRDMKIAVLLSGGVDSSVALRLVKQAGHRDITAFYLKIWLEDELAHLGNCPWEEDLQYARAVCEEAGVPLKIVSLQTEYQERVVAAAL